MSNLDPFTQKLLERTQARKEAARLNKLNNAKSVGTPLSDKTNTNSNKNIPIDVFTTNEDSSETRKRSKTTSNTATKKNATPLEVREDPLLLCKSEAKPKRRMRRSISSLRAHRIHHRKHLSSRATTNIQAPSMMLLLLSINLIWN